MSKKKWLVGGLVLVVVLAGAVWFFFLRDDAPDLVSSAAANEQLDADLAALDDDPADAEPDADEPPDTDPVDGNADATIVEPEPEESGFDGTINGNWVVNEEIGDFDFETASGSFAGFRVTEELTVVGDTTAVGRTGGVSGTITIADGTLTAAEITVDMTSIVSDRPQREGAIRRAISAPEFPTATFVFADSVDVSAITVGGEAMSFPVAGELTVSGVTQLVTFLIEANVRDDGFGIITGSTGIVWQDFGITPPSASVVVSVADEGIVEFQLVVEQG